MSQTVWLSSLQRNIIIIFLHFFCCLFAKVCDFRIFKWMSTCSVQNLSISFFIWMTNQQKQIWERKEFVTNKIILKKKKNHSIYYYFAAYTNDGRCVCVCVCPFVFGKVFIFFSLVVVPSMFRFNNLFFWDSEKDVPRIYSSHTLLSLSFDICYAISISQRQN